MSFPGLRADDLSVRRLRLRAPGRSPDARGALARELARGLERADWPSPPGDAWVLVRRLAVTATRAALPDRARVALTACLAGAAEAGSPEAEGAQAVRFRDLPALIAHLAADLAAGRAGERWYWRRWPELLRLSPAEALASLLGDQVEHLGTVTERLAGRGVLAAVWRALTPAQARALQERLAARLAMPLPAAGAGEESAGLVLSLPPALRVRWAPALLGLPRDDPRRRLAACLTALEWRPLELADGRAGSFLAALADSLGPTADRPGAPAEEPDLRGGTSDDGATRAESATLIPRLRPGRAPTAAGPTTEGLHPFAPGLERVAGDPWPPPPDPSGYGDGSSGPAPSGRSAPDRGPAPASVPPGVSSARGGPEPTPGHGPASARLQPPGAAPDPVDGGPPPDMPERDRSGVDAFQGSPEASRESGLGARSRAPGRPGVPSDAPDQGAVRPDPGLLGSPAAVQVDPSRPAPVWETEEGGLFYLINFLARPEAQALLRAGLGAGASAGADGWAWLAGLGLRLGLAPDGALARFLAERLDLPLGPDRPCPLADLPALPGGADLLDLGGRLYAGGSVWSPELLRVPARVHHGPTHLDVDYPLAAVRVEVRLVGLDVNPGWVPWLGRVVSFRYLEGWSVPRARASPEGGGRA